MFQRLNNVWLLLSIALISASALAYQLLLMRMLAIVHWYPFAAMIVSLALLGHGISGTVLAFAGAWARPRFTSAFATCAAAFGIAAPLCFALAQRIAFNGLELVWDLGQVPRLAAIYLLLALPFFLAATCFGLAFIALSGRIPRLYAADLIGAGAGAVGLIGMLYVLELPAVLRAVALGGTLAAGLALLHAQRLRPALATLALGSAAALLIPTAWIAPHVNSFKGLSKALLVEDTRIVVERSGPLGWLSVIESPRLPLRHVPGLSLNATQEPAPQLGLFTDGDGLSAITAYHGDPTALEYLGQTTSALPYALHGAPSVLILGAGGGTDVRQALQLGAKQVTAVELNPQIVGWISGRFAAFSGHVYDDPRVRVSIGDARGALRSSSDSYDLIQLPLVDSAVGAGAGVQAAADDFLYTVESLREAYARLRDGGYLAVTRWEAQPPRDSLKLFATAIAALRAEGSADPGSQLALIRSWQTSTLLLRKGALDAVQIDLIRGFCERLSFDLAYLPGLGAAQANRFNQVEVPYLYEGAQALLGANAADYFADYKFDLAPATDARPFFHNFFRWRTLPELWRLRGRGSAALLDSGYLVLAATLAQALPLALVLIVLPLLALRSAAPAVSRWGPAAYFLCLGLGFLFVEIAALSRFTLFIGHPLWAATTVLGAMLAFAGLGSALSLRWQRRRRPLLAAAATVTALLLGYELALPWAFSAAAAWPIVAKSALSCALLAPLAFAMGMPFPLGLSRLADTTPALIPWAWGINGCASVLSALLALMLAIDFGYQAVVLAAAGLYVLAGLLWR